MRTALIGIGAASLAFAGYQLYLRQTKKAKDDTIADVVVFGAIGIGAILIAKK